MRNNFPEKALLQIRDRVLNTPLVSSLVFSLLESFSRRTELPKWNAASFMGTRRMTKNNPLAWMKIFFSTCQRGNRIIIIIIVCFAPSFLSSSRQLFSRTLKKNNFFYNKQFQLNLPIFPSILRATLFKKIKKEQME